ncbi:hypothetical protein D9M72_567040 [compost metagenome]
MRLGKAEGADAADWVPRLGLHLVEAEHAGFGAEAGLVLLVVEAGVATRDDEDHIVADTKRQGLGDLRRFDAVALGCERNRGGALLKLDDIDIWGVLGKEVFDGSQAHGKGFTLSKSDGDQPRCEQPSRRSASRGQISQSSLEASRSSGRRPSCPGGR